MFFCNQRPRKNLINNLFPRERGPPAPTKVGIPGFPKRGPRKLGIPYNFCRKIQKSVRAPNGDPGNWEPRVLVSFLANFCRKIQNEVL